MTVKVYIPIIEGSHVGQEFDYEGNLFDLINHQFDVENYTKDNIPVVVKVNDRVVRLSAWKSTNVDNYDDVGIYLTQRGGIFSGIGSLLGGIFSVVFGIFGLGGKSRTPGKSVTQQGAAAEALDLRANTPRPGATVPEVGGRIVRRPDMLNEPHKEWINPRTQVMRMLLAVSVGKVQLGDSDVLVGSTPMVDLGDNARWRLYHPGEDLSNEPAAQLWFHSDEVGSTSSGQAGIELPVDAASANNIDPSDGYSFLGNDVTRGEGEFPSGWGAGTDVNLVVPIVTEVTRETVSLLQRNRFSGYFGHLGISFGDRVTVSVLGYFVMDLDIGSLSLDQNGFRWIEMAYPPPEPGDPDPANPWFNGLDPGEYTIIISTQPAKKWRINQFSKDKITVVRLLPNGQVDPGWSGFPPLSIYGSSVSFAGGRVFGEWTGMYVCTPFGELSRNIEFDVFFPRGLGKLKDSGGIDGYSVSIEYEFRDIITSNFRSFIRTYSENTNDQIGFTERFSVPAGWRFQARMRRVGEKSTDVQVLDDVQWTALRSRMVDLNRYENWSVLAIEYSKGGKISAQTENQVVTIPTRILPELNPDGSWSGEKPTRQIAAMFRYVANANGYADSQIDMDELLRLQNQYWTPRGETFDHVIDATTTKNAFNMILGAGLAEYTISGDMVRPVRAGVRTVFEQGYSPLNIVGSVKHEIKPHADDEYDGLIVEYMDERTWEKEQVRCFLPGDIGKKTTTLKADGIVDRKRAYQFGMRRRCEQEYQRQTFSFQTSVEGMNSNYGSYVPIIDTLREYGEAAILQSSANVGGVAYLTVTESFDHGPGKDYVVSYRDDRGNVHGPYTVIHIDGKSIRASIPENETPKNKMHQEPIHIYFGEANRWAYAALVEEVAPSDGIYCKINAVNYDDRVYQYDNASPSEDD